MEKKLNDYTKIELVNMPEKEYDRLMNEYRAEQQPKIDAENKNFEENIYSNYTLTEKAGYWGENINKRMRYQAEWGLNEYEGFTPQWYVEMKVKEPQLDEIFELMFTIPSNAMAFYWDKDLFFNKIGKA